MSSHPNRPNRPLRRKAQGANPKPAEIAQLRDEMELTQAEAGEILYASERTWQDWERGERRMHPAMWEYLNLLWAFREVEAAREVWVKGGDPRPIRNAVREPRASEPQSAEHGAAAHK